ncbi:DUF3519 domain-containing protein, partial [Helicobacter pylori]
NNTLKIIEELNNGVKSASEEIKEASKKSAEIKRDFSDTKLSNDEIKELLNNAEIPTSGRDAITFGVNNLNPEMVEFLHKNNKKMIIEKASNKELELLKDAHFKHPENIRASLDHDAIAHILKRHGVNSVNVKNGEIPVTNEDIANYRYIVNNADAILRTLDNENKEVISAFKQINGYAVVVEQAINRKNELALKTMYKSNGDYKDNNAYKKFSSTLTLNADAKVNHRLSSYSGATENTTPKPLNSQEDLLKTSENLNETTQEVKNLSPLEQAEAEKLAKLESAITPLKEFGTNYPEFALKPKEALEKLLQEKNGQVAGAAYKEDLGGIDFVWGTPKTKESVGYGLAHVLERREQQALADGLSEAEAKEYALNIVKSIPEVLEKGVKVERNGRMAIEYQNIRVGLKDNWKGEKLPNHWVITGYEKRSENSESLYTSPLITKGETLPLNSNEPNPTTNALKTQEPLSEQANAKKLIKEQRAITPLKEFGTNYPEFALKPKEALEKLLQEKNGQVAGAAYREDLGGIDFVWGTPKTKDSNGYGLAHILEKREKQYKRLGLTNEQAKERTKELLKQIPEVIEKGIKDNDYIGHATIRHNGIEVGLSSQKGNTPLKNHYMITSFETDEKVLRELETIGTLSNNYRDGINYSTSNLDNPNPTTNAIKMQESLSPLEQANAKKLAKLETEKEVKAEALKKLNFDEIKKLIDESPRTGSSVPILGMQNLNAEAVEYIQKNHKRIAVEKIEPSFAKDLKLKYPNDARAVIDYQAINHILKEHKNLSFQDIANYRALSKQANETLKLKDNQNRPVVASFNQINGFFVVVEQVSNAKNELILKTMYKARGNYKDSLTYKRTLAKSQNSN